MYKIQLYGWLIANDSFWPSIFGLLFLGLSSYSTVPAVLRDGFGNSTVLLLFFFFAFTNIISAAGITEYIARWIVSRKVCLLYTSRLPELLCLCPGLLLRRAEPDR